MSFLFSILVACLTVLNLPPKKKMFVEYFLGGSSLLVNNVFLAVHVQSPGIKHSERRWFNDMNRFTWLNGTFSVVTRGINGAQNSWRCIQCPLLYVF